MRPSVSQISLIAILVLATNLFGVGVLLLAPLYTRLETPAQVLQNATRSKLLDMVRSRPGLSVAQAARELDVARTTVGYHARKLRRAQMIAVACVAGKAFLRPPLALRPIDDWILAEARFATVLSTLAGSPGLTREELGQRLVMLPKRTRNHHVRRLIELGAVEERLEAGRRRLYVVTPHARARTSGAAPPSRDSVEASSPRE